MLVIICRKHPNLLLQQPMVSSSAPRKSSAAKWHTSFVADKWGERHRESFLSGKPFFSGIPAIAPNTLTSEGASLFTIRPIMTANSTSSILAVVALALACRASVIEAGY